MADPRSGSERHVLRSESNSESLKERLKNMQMNKVRNGGDGRAGKENATYGIDRSRVRLEEQMEVLQGRLQTIRETPTLQRKTVGRVQQDDGFGGLAAKLESLRQREKPSSSVTTDDGKAFDSQGLSRSAQQLFGDAEFVGLCEKGLKAQLTRTRDGATQEMRMRELADIVKTMRKALKEMQQRTQMFVELSVKYERDASSQVERVKLSADSAAMAASAEIANLRRDAATEAANHKAAFAQWQGEMDLQKSETAGLKREIERLQQEYDSLQQEFGSLKSAKGGVETELHELKRAISDREKELQAGKNAATQTVYQVKEDFERQKAELMDALQQAREHVSIAEEAKRQLGAELKSAKEHGESMNADMKKTVSELESTTAELETTKQRLADVQGQYEKLMSDLNSSKNDYSSTNKKLGEWQQKAADLLQELEKEREASAKLRQSAEKYADTAATQEETLKEAKAKYEDEIAEMKQRVHGLEKERDALKEAMETGATQHEQAKEAMEKLTSELEETRGELKDAKEALEKLQEEGSSALKAVEKANERADTAEAKLIEVEKEASEKASKLAQLEGELEALQECTYGLEGGDQKELLSRMVSKIASLEAAVVAADAKRREAHNQLVELKGNIRVFCRLRPNPSSVAQVSSDGTSIRIYADSKPYEFNYDKVFKPEATQTDIFNQVSDLVQSALDGYNVCLFSYGQTGAGKTHTMQGNNVPGQEGIIPRSIAKILKTVATLKEQGWEYTLEASYIEVYNEQLRDLLAEGKGAGKITENNAIQHSPNGGPTIVHGATRLPITSEYDAEEIVARAAASRAVESTAMNSTSSRSHSVFMLYISGCHEATETSLQGSLNLVDLAGSERLNRSQVEGQRAKEACSINKSLSSLGDVFAALSSKQAHIPYRNSKLTHLLQPCLGGSGKTLMFVNINPEAASAQESLCSLRFASKVNQCETAARGGAKRHTSMLDRGRPSIAPTGRESGAGTRRQSIAPTARVDSRRASMIPSSKRKAMGPPPNPTSRARFE